MNTTENKMAHMPIPKLLYSMALPLILAMIVQAFYNIADSFFVSRINENALTAVSLAFPIQILMIAFAVGTGVGVNSLLSRSLGAGKQKQANETANHAIFLWIITSLVFVLIALTSAKWFFSLQTDDPQILEYGVKYFQICVGLSFGLFGQFIFENLLRATGRSFETMITQLTGAIINIILDPIFIFTLNLGVAGAAYATVVGQLAAFILAVYLNNRKNKDITISMKSFKPNKHILLDIYKVAVPSIMLQSLGSLVTFSMNLILINFTTTATAVYGIYFKLESFFFLPLYGMKNALVPIIGYNYGAKQKDRMKEALRLAMISSLIFMFIGTLVFLFFPNLLLQIFKPDSQMLLIGVPALRIISLCFPFAAISIIVGGLFDATGNGVYTLINSSIRQIIVLLPAAFLISLLGELRLIWWAYPIAECFSIVATIILFKRLMSKNKL